MDTTTAEEVIARYKNPEDLLRAPSPGPDFTGWTAAEVKEVRHRAGDRWTQAESAKIQELRDPPKQMPWKQISKIIGKTPLACRLRMNQIKKARLRAAGIVEEPKAKSGAKSPRGKKAKQQSSSPPPAKRHLVPAEAQRALPAFPPAGETSTLLPSFRDVEASTTNQGHPTAAWGGHRYQPPPQQQQYQPTPYTTHPFNMPQQQYHPSQYGSNPLNTLAHVAHEAGRHRPDFHAPMPIRTAEAPRWVAGQESAASRSDRRVSNIHRLLNQENNA